MLYTYYEEYDFIELDNIEDYERVCISRWYKVEECNLILIIK